jgi:fructose-1,6-bisphosphatase/inositol monophosphatase family enzyme
VDLTPYRDFVIELAERSGELIRPYFGAGAGTLGIELKADESIVTRADREAEALMRELIARRFPEHGILGEEYGEERASAEFVWVLDPIDGTISFASASPLFGTLIALLHEGTPLLGAIHQPVLRQLCHQDGPAFEALMRDVKLVRTWGDCYGYLLLATGHADIMCDPVMNPWDIAALIPVVRGAGGVITDWQGREAIGARSIVATTSPALHDEVIRRLNPL